MDRESAGCAGETPLAKWQRLRVALNPSNAITFRLSLIEHRGSELDPVHLRTEVLQGDGVISRTACDVEVRRAGPKIQMPCEAPGNAGIGFACGVVAAADTVVERHPERCISLLIDAHECRRGALHQRRSRRA